MTAARCAAKHGKAFYLFLFTFYGMQFRLARSRCHSRHSLNCRIYCEKQWTAIHLHAHLSGHYTAQPLRATMHAKMLSPFRMKALNFRSRSLKNLLCLRVLCVFLFAVVAATPNKSQFSLIKSHCDCQQWRLGCHVCFDAPVARAGAQLYFYLLQVVRASEAHPH